LARAKGHRPRASFLRKLTPHHGLDSHRQHHGKSLRESTGWHKILKTQSAATSIWERCLQNGLRIQAQHIPGIQNKTADYASRHFFHEKPVATSPYSLPTESNTMGTPRRRSLCRPDIQSTSAIRLLEARPGSTSNGRAIHSMEPISESLPQPTLEPNPFLPQENTDGESSTGHDSGAFLADSHMVPSTTTDGDAYTNTDRPPTADTRHCAFRNLTMDKQTLETLRLESIRNRFQLLGYSQHMIDMLSKAIEAQTGPKTPYRRAQYLFLQ
jgi:hypothetical protein